MAAVTVPLERGGPKVVPADTILVIDDSVTFRAVLKDIFEAASYTVVVTGTGEEGLPKHKLKRRGRPPVRAGVDHADRPANGGPENQPVAQEGFCVAPVKCIRIEHKQQSEKAEQDADDLPGRYRFSQEQPGSGSDPQRCRVAQNDRAPGRNKFQSSRHQGRKRDHVK